MDENKILKFVRLIGESNRAVFFGGAGVSTESGMKDYRSKDGLYETVKQYNVSPETILSRSFFEKHPDIFYDFYYHYFLNTSAKPNRAHFALADLEKRGKLQAVITQNIDGLHQQAGSQNVLELHGTVLRNSCPACGAFMTAEEIKALRGEIPRCKACGHIVKPHVVLYEEPLDEQVIRAAIDAIAAADLLIIGGTSLAVYPAAGFIRYFRGEHIVLINRDETPSVGNTSLVFRENIGEVLSETVKRLP